MATAEASGFQSRRLVFWDFPRASWQYDVVVALILVFIFTVPRPFFGDQPRASGVVLMSSEHGEYRFFIASDLLAMVDASSRKMLAEKLIQKRTGGHKKVTRLEPIKDESDREIRGFIAYTTR